MKKLLHTFIIIGIVVINISDNNTFAKNKKWSDYSYCRNGIIETGEQCDSGIGCNDSCQLKNNAYMSEFCNGSNNCVLPNIKPTQKRQKKDYVEGPNYCSNCHIKAYREVYTPWFINGEWSSDISKNNNLKTNSNTWINIAQDVLYEAVWEKNTHGKSRRNYPEPNDPGNKPIPRGTKLEIKYLGHTCNGKTPNGKEIKIYADSKQNCEFIFEFVKNQEGYSKELTGEIAGIEKLRVGDFHFDGAYIDQIKKQQTPDKKQETGLIFNTTEKIIGVNGRYILKIQIKSTVPFIAKNKVLKFYIQGLKKIGEVRQIIPNLAFYTPVKLNSKNRVGKNGKKTSLTINDGNPPEIGRDQIYNVHFEILGDSDLSDVKNGKLYLDQVYINLLPENLYKIIGGTVLKKKFEDITKGIEKALTIKIDSKIEDKRVNLNSANLSINLKTLPISYVLNEKLVKYPIAPGNPLTGCNKKTNGLLVEGGVQSDGKGEITGQEKFSDLSSSEMRNTIRKNAYKLIRGRENKTGIKIGTVYYNEGDTNYKQIENILKENDTIIIKNGNLIIDKDIKTPVGVIVLSDKYDAQTNYEKGNIYIRNYVKNINAIIYADGALWSRNLAGVSYQDEYLKTSLVITGAIFTRNTIGGAIAGAGSETYKLPGGYKTENFKEAESFDLNYLRKANLCKAPYYSVKVKYNTKFQLNPPKGF